MQADAAGTLASLGGQRVTDGLPLDRGHQRRTPRRKRGRKRWSAGPSVLLVVRPNGELVRLSEPHDLLPGEGESR